MSKKVAVLLSGCGVYDGSEIHETVLSLLELENAGLSYQCFAPDINQHHVINHLNGEEMKESRNVLIESARIARGNIKNLNDLELSDFDALMLPGGFGAAKNWTKWAFEGAQGDIHEGVQALILTCVSLGKPIVALCMSPTVVAKALEGKNLGEQLTVGTGEHSSPYDIAGISAGMESLGARAEARGVQEISVDEEHKIISSPCYMMEAGISDIHKGIQKSVQALAAML